MAYYGFKPAEQAIQIGDNTIVSADIADGSIVNADLNSSAAIAMSKTQLTAGTGITLATNTLNVDAAQTQITSVGTLSSLTTSGVVLGANGSESAPSFSFSSDTNTGIYRGAEDTLRISTGGTERFEIGNTQAKITGNFITTGTLDVRGTGSSIITGDYLYLDAHNNTSAKNLVFRQLDDTWLGQIEFHPSSPAQIVTRVAQPLKLGANNIKVLTLRHETNQWGAEIVSQSPYGLHVHTTGTSSGHDALKVSRHDDAILFHVFADANTINKNALTVQGTGTSSFTGGLTVNEGGGDNDFRVESDTNEYALFVDAGNSCVGINTNNTDHPLCVKLDGAVAYNQSTDLNGETALWLNGTDGDGEATMIRWANHGAMNNYFGCVQVGSSSQADFVWTAYNGSNYSEKLRVRASGHIIAKQLNQTGSTSNRYPLYWVHTGTDGSIEPYTGSVRAMKTDIADMGSVDWIHSLKPRRFKFRDFEDVDGVRTYKNTTNDNPTTEYGLIAEEVNEVEGSDYILDKNSDGEVKGVLYHNLVPILLKSIQELFTEVEKLKGN